VGKRATTSVIFTTIFISASIAPIDYLLAEAPKHPDTENFTRPISLAYA
jgi:hypothetical protein